MASEDLLDIFNNGVQEDSGMNPAQSCLLLEGDVGNVAKINSLSEVESTSKQQALVLTDIESLDITSNKEATGQQCERVDDLLISTEFNSENTTEISIFQVGSDLLEQKPSEESKVLPNLPLLATTDKQPLETSSNQDLLGLFESNDLQEKGPADSSNIDLLGGLLQPIVDNQTNSTGSINPPLVPLDQVDIFGVSEPSADQPSFNAEKDCDKDSIQVDLLMEQDNNAKVLDILGSTSVFPTSNPVQSTSLTDQNMFASNHNLFNTGSMFAATSEIKSNLNANEFIAPILTGDKMEEFSDVSGGAPVATEKSTLPNNSIEIADVATTIDNTGESESFLRQSAPIEHSSIVHHAALSELDNGTTDSSVDNMISWGQTEMTVQSSENKVCSDTPKSEAQILEPNELFLMNSAVSEPQKVGLGKLIDNTSEQNIKHKENPDELQNVVDELLDSVYCEVAKEFTEHEGNVSFETDAKISKSFSGNKLQEFGNVKGDVAANETSSTIFDEISISGIVQLSTPESNTTVSEETNIKYTASSCEEDNNEPSKSEQNSHAPDIIDMKSVIIDPVISINEVPCTSSGSSTLTSDELKTINDFESKLLNDDADHMSESKPGSSVLVSVFDDNGNSITSDDEKFGLGFDQQETDNMSYSVTDAPIQFSELSDAVMLPEGNKFDDVDNKTTDFNDSEELEGKSNYIQEAESHDLDRNSMQLPSLSGSVNDLSIAQDKDKQTTNYEKQDGILQTENLTPPSDRLDEELSIDTETFETFSAEEISLAKECEASFVSDQSNDNLVCYDDSQSNEASKMGTTKISENSTQSNSLDDSQNIPGHDILTSFIPQESGEASQQSTTITFCENLAKEILTNAMDKCFASNHSSQSSICDSMDSECDSQDLHSLTSDLLVVDSGPVISLNVTLKSAPPPEPNDLIVKDINSNSPNIVGLSNVEAESTLVEKETFMSCDAKATIHSDEPIEQKNSLEFVTNNTQDEGFMSVDALSGLNCKIVSETVCGVMSEDSAGEQKPGVLHGLSPPDTNPEQNQAVKTNMQLLIKEDEMLGGIAESPNAVIEEVGQNEKVLDGHERNSNFEKEISQSDYSSNVAEVASVENSISEFQEGLEHTESSLNPLVDESEIQEMTSISSTRGTTIEKGVSETEFMQPVAPLRKKKKKITINPEDSIANNVSGPINSDSSQIYELEVSNGSDNQAQPGFVLEQLSKDVQPYSVNIETDDANAKLNEELNCGIPTQQTISGDSIDSQEHVTDNMNYSSKEVDLEYLDFLDGHEDTSAQNQVELLAPEKQHDALENILPATSTSGEDLLESATSLTSKPPIDIKLVPGLSESKTSSNTEEASSGIDAFNFDETSPQATPIKYFTASNLLVPEDSGTPEICGEIPALSALPDSTIDKNANVVVARNEISDFSLKENVTNNDLLLVDAENKASDNKSGVSLIIDHNPFKELESGSTSNSFINDDDKSEVNFNSDGDCSNYGQIPNQYHEDVTLEKKSDTGLNEISGEMNKITTVKNADDEIPSSTDGTTEVLASQDLAAEMLSDSGSIIESNFRETNSEKERNDAHVVKNQENEIAANSSDLFDSISSPPMEFDDIYLNESDPGKNTIATRFIKKTQSTSTERITVISPAYTGISYSSTVPSSVFIDKDLLSDESDEDSLVANVISTSEDEDLPADNDRDKSKVEFEDYMKLLLEYSKNDEGNMHSFPLSPFVSSNSEEVDYTYQGFDSGWEEIAQERPTYPSLPAIMEEPEPSDNDEPDSTGYIITKNSSEKNRESDNGAATQSNEEVVPEVAPPNIIITDNFGNDECMYDEQDSERSEKSGNSTPEPIKSDLGEIEGTALESGSMPEKTEKENGIPDHGLYQGEKENVIEMSVADSKTATNQELFLVDEVDERIDYSLSGGTIKPIMENGSIVVEEDIAADLKRDIPCNDQNLLGTVTDQDVTLSVSDIDQSLVLVSPETAMKTQFEGASQFNEPPLIDNSSVYAAKEVNATVISLADDQNAVFYEEVSQSSGFIAENIIQSVVSETVADKDKLTLADNDHVLQDDNANNSSSTEKTDGVEVETVENLLSNENPFDLNATINNNGELDPNTEHSNVCVMIPASVKHTAQENPLFDFDKTQKAPSTDISESEISDIKSENNEKYFSGDLHYEDESGQINVTDLSNVTVVVKDDTKAHEDISQISEFVANDIIQNVLMENDAADDVTKLSADKKSDEYSDSVPSSTIQIVGFHSAGLMDIMEDEKEIVDTENILSGSDNSGDQRTAVIRGSEGESFSSTSTKEKPTNYHSHKTLSIDDNNVVETSVSALHELDSGTKNETTFSDISAELNPSMSGNDLYKNDGSALVSVSGHGPNESYRMQSKTLASDASIEADLITDTIDTGIAEGETITLLQENEEKKLDFSTDEFFEQSQPSLGINDTVAENTVSEVEKIDPGMGIVDTENLLSGIDNSGDQRTIVIQGSEVESFSSTSTKENPTNCHSHAILSIDDTIVMETSVNALNELDSGTKNETIFSDISAELDRSMSGNEVYKNDGSALVSVSGHGPNGSYSMESKTLVSNVGIEADLITDTIDTEIAEGETITLLQENEEKKLVFSTDEFFEQSQSSLGITDTVAVIAVSEVEKIDAGMTIESTIRDTSVASDVSPLGHFSENESASASVPSHTEDESMTIKTDTNIKTALTTKKNAREPVIPLQDAEENKLIASSAQPLVSSGNNDTVVETPIIAIDEVDTGSIIETTISNKSVTSNQGNISSENGNILENAPDLGSVNSTKESNGVQSRTVFNDTNIETTILSDTIANRVLSETVIQSGMNEERKPVMDTEESELQQVMPNSFENGAAKDFLSDNVLSIGQQVSLSFAPQEDQSQSSTHQTEESATLEISSIEKDMHAPPPPPARKKKKVKLEEDRSSDIIPANDKGTNVTNKSEREALTELFPDRNQVHGKFSSDPDPRKVEFNGKVQIHSYEVESQKPKKKQAPLPPVGLGKELETTFTRDDTGTGNEICKKQTDATTEDKLSSDPSSIPIKAPPRRTKKRAPLPPSGKVSLESVNDQSQDFSKETNKISETEKTPSKKRSPAPPPPILNESAGDSKQIDGDLKGLKEAIETKPEEKTVGIAAGDNGMFLSGNKKKEANESALLEQDFVSQGAVEEYSNTVLLPLEISKRDITLLGDIVGPQASENHENLANENSLLVTKNSNFFSATVLPPSEYTSEDTSGVLQKQTETPSFPADALQEVSEDGPLPSSLFLNEIVPRHHDEHLILTNNSDTKTLEEDVKINVDEGTKVLESCDAVILSMMMEILDEVNKMDNMDDPFGRKVNEYELQGTENFDMSQAMHVVEQEMTDYVLDLTQTQDDLIYDEKIEVLSSDRVETDAQSQDFAQMQEQTYPNEDVLNVFSEKMTSTILDMSSEQLSSNGSQISNKLPNAEEITETEIKGSETDSNNVDESSAAKYLIPTKDSDNTAAEIAESETENSDKPSVTYHLPLKTDSDSTVVKKSSHRVRYETTGSVGSLDFLTDSEEEEDDAERLRKNQEKLISLDDDAVADEDDVEPSESFSSDDHLGKSHRKSLVPPSSLILSVALDDVDLSEDGTKTAETADALTSELETNLASSVGSSQTSLASSTSDVTGKRSSLPKLPSLRQEKSSETATPPLVRTNIQLVPKESIIPLSPKPEGLRMIRWEKVTVKNIEYQIDETAIQPYKKVISHGGFYDSKSPIIEIFTSYLPSSNTEHYAWVMDNLFLYVLATVELLASEKFSVVMFVGHTPKNRIPANSLLKRWHEHADYRLKKNVEAFYIMNPTFYFKAMATLFVSRKVMKKMKYIKSMAELKAFIPTDFLFVPPEIAK